MGGYKFFKHDVVDIGPENGWPEGVRFEGRFLDMRINVEVDGSGKTFSATLRALEQKVHDLRGRFESVSA